jgi:hypothetical protein
VPGHVDKPQLEAGGGPQVCEADVDGDPAAFFFLQAVGIDAGQRADQSGLAVIDVPGGADDDVLNRVLQACAPRSGTKRQ